MADESTERVCEDEDILYLLDVFTGADGGIAYYNFARFMAEMQKRAGRGDEAAEKLTKMLRDFTRLVRIADREGRKPTGEKA